jgi:hypothetical protein
MLSPPAPLSRNQRLLFWLVTIVCAATRWLARARSLWDWDEALFCLGVRSYDVSMHHPHPPGFPLFIGIAKAIRPLVSSDFRALQTISLVSGMLLFPAVFFLARELRMRFGTCVIAGALCAFFPNVWFFGGTAFSDVPSIVLVVVAAALLFRGVRSPNAYIAGSLLLAISIGFRPQNFLIGLFPGVLATWYRWRSNWRDVIFAALIGVTVVGASYGGAILATGSPDRYLGAVRQHRDYITATDSFRNPARPSLWHLFDRFFVMEYQSAELSVTTSLFVLIATVETIRRRYRPALFALATFGPMAITAWLMLDRFSISRFSIGYIPLFALLAADGISRVAGTAEQERPPGARRAWLEPLVGTTLVAAFFLWTLPALTPIRREISPTVAAVTSLPRLVDRRNDQLYVGVAMAPFMEYFQPHFPWRRVLDEGGMPIGITNKRPLLLAERDYSHPVGIVWSRRRGRLWRIARRHYFDVSLSPLTNLATFGEGWSAPERAETNDFRWMSGHSVTTLPPAYGETMLRIEANIPGELVAKHPTVIISLNGKVLDRVKPADEHIHRDYQVQPNGSGPNVLELSTDRVSRPGVDHDASDPRELGLQLKFLSWGTERG